MNFYIIILYIVYIFVMKDQICRIKSQQTVAQKSSTLPGQYDVIGSLTLSSWWQDSYSSMSTLVTDMCVSWTDGLKCCSKSSGRPSSMQSLLQCQPLCHIQMNNCELDGTQSSKMISSKTLSTKESDYSIVSPLSSIKEAQSTLRKRNYQK